MKQKLVFGIDIGGINTAIGIVDSLGRVYCECVVATSDYPYYDQYSDYIRCVAENMKVLLSNIDFDYELVGIGIGAPNASYHRGVIDRPANLWKFKQNGDDSLRIFPLVEDLKSYFPECKRVYITNDANAATVGEKIFGAGRGMQDFVMVTLGTGLGSGFIVNGEMVYGQDGFAGELGHTIIEHNGRECGCGLNGCIETYVSAKGICRTAFEVMSRLKAPSLLRDIPFSQLSSLQLAQAAKQGVN